jgi:hypothetical protein
VNPRHSPRGISLSEFWGLIHHSKGYPTPHMAPSSIYLGLNWECPHGSDTYSYTTVPVTHCNHSQSTTDRLREYIDHTHSHTVLIRLGMSRGSFGSRYRWSLSYLTSGHPSVPPEDRSTLWSQRLPFVASLSGRSVDMPRFARCQPVAPRGAWVGLGHTFLSLLPRIVGPTQALTTATGSRVVIVVRFAHTTWTLVFPSLVTCPRLASLRLRASATLRRFAPSYARELDSRACSLGAREANGLLILLMIYFHHTEMTMTPDREDLELLKNEPNQWDIQCDKLYNEPVWFELPPQDNSYDRMYTLLREGGIEEKEAHHLASLYTTAAQDSD